MIAISIGETTTGARPLSVAELLAVDRRLTPAEQARVDAALEASARAAQAQAEARGRFTSTSVDTSAGTAVTVSPLGPRPAKRSRGGASAPVIYEPPRQYAPAEPTARRPVALPPAPVMRAGISALAAFGIGLASIGTSLAFSRGARR